MPEAKENAPVHVLVLGGCGFIGSHIVDALLDRGIKVRVVDRSPEHYRQPLPKVDYRFFDFHDSEQLAQALADIDVVVHALSSTTPAPSNDAPIHDIENNLIGTVQLLEMMRKRHIQRIVFLSSGGTVYGVPQTLPIHEEHALHPLCSYAAVKIAIENYLNIYAHLHGFRPTILRTANPYGARQNPESGQGVIAAFAKRILQDQPITLWGDGSIVRDFFEVRDLACLCAMTIEQDCPGTFNVGSGHGHSLNEIIDSIASITGHRADINRHPSRPFDIPEIYLDIDKAQRTFGWQPEISLESGIRNYCDWLQEHL